MEAEEVPPVVRVPEREGAGEGVPVPEGEAK